MLQIKVKQEIKATKSETKYTLQSQSEEEIKQFTDRQGPIDLAKIKDYCRNRSSMDAEILAMFISKILASLKEESVKQSVELLLTLMDYAYDRRQLLYLLKSKYRIDAKLLLVALWNYRRQVNALKLVDIVLDAYTLQLMLNAKQITALWKQYINNLVSSIKCKQDLVIKLTQATQNQIVKNKDIGQYRTISIPL